MYETVTRANFINIMEKPYPVSTITNATTCRPPAAIRIQNTPPPELPAHTSGISEVVELQTKVNPTHIYTAAGACTIRLVVINQPAVGYPLIVDQCGQHWEPPQPALHHHQHLRQCQRAIATNTSSPPKAVHSGISRCTTSTLANPENIQQPGTPLPDQTGEPIQWLLGFTDQKILL